MEEFNLCSKCVNWLEHSKNSISCDFEFFENVPLEKAIIYVPELFNCEEYEELTKND